MATAYLAMRMILGCYDLVTARLRVNGLFIDDWKPAAGRIPGYVFSIPDLLDLVLLAIR
jgi:hypothetical protein